MDLRAIFRVALVFCCGLAFVTVARSEVPDCAKEEGRQTKAPLKPVVPASKLLNFCGNRVPGRFFVKVKDKERLTKDVPPPVASKLDVLPGLVPDNRAKSIVLGRAFAEKYHAIFSDNHCSNDCRYYRLDEISDADAATMALDPRIEYMEPDKLAIAQ